MGIGNLLSENQWLMHWHPQNNLWPMGAVDGRS